MILMGMNLDGFLRFADAGGILILASLIISILVFILFIRFLYYVPFHLKQIADEMKKQTDLMSLQNNRNLVDRMNMMRSENEKQSGYR